MSPCRLIPFALVVLLSAAPVRGQNTALTWSGAGADSNWTTVGNWNFTSTGTPAGVYPNNGQPSAGNTYDATLSGNPTLNTSVTINNFTWSGGTLSGSGTLTLNVGANLVGNPFLGVSIVNTSGSVATFSVAGSMYSNSGALWTNQSGSTFSFTTDSNLFVNAAAGTFNNNGGAIFQKTGGTGSSSVAWNFTNNGTVNATSGTLAFTGTNTQNGSMTVGTGATVQFASGGVSTWTGTAGSSGVGTVQIQGGTVNFNGTNTLASAVSMVGGVIDGTGAMTISGPLTWSGGNIGASSSPGVGTTALSGGGTINGTVFLNRAITNASGSSVSIAGGVNLYSNPNASWTNQSGSTFTFSSDGGLAINAGTGTFTNNTGAIFQKTGGTGSSSIAWNFSNSGTVNATSGTLAFTGTNTQNGPITVGTGATVQFTGASTWTGTAGSSGLGTVQLQSGTTLFNGADNLATAVSMTSGTLDGTGVMTISGPFTWSGGNIGAGSSPGAGATALSGGGTINGTVFLNRAITNASGSAVSIAGAVNLYSNPNATWTNQSGSTLNLTSDGGLLINAGTGTFTNNTGATFEKTAGTGTSSVAWNFTNNGTVNATSGTLAFTGTNTQNGPITVGTGATVQFTGASTWTGTAGSSGLGTVQLQSGTTLFNGADNLATAVSMTSGTLDGTGVMTISGPFTWSGGNLGAGTSPGAGTTALSGGGTINGTVFLNRAITNASGSAVSIAGAVNLYSNPNATWTNQSGSTLNLTSDGGLLINAGTGTFTNNTGATFEKTAGTGTSSVAWNFTNNGTVVAASGTLAFSSTPTLSNYSAGTLTGGTWRVLAGATLDLGSRPISTIAAGTTVEVNGVGSTFADLDNHLTTVSGNLNVYGGRSFTPSGNLADNGAITVGQTAGDGSQINGAVTVNSGGVLGGSGAVTGTVTLTTGGTVSSNGFDFTVGSLTGTAGTVTNNAATPGSLTVGTDNTSTTFGGTITDGTGAAFTLVKVGSGTLTLTGTSTYTGGTNVQVGTVAVAGDANLGGGSVTSNSLGTLAFTATATTTKSYLMNGGTISVPSGKTVTFNGGQVSGAYLDGAGTFATGASGTAFVGTTSLPSVTVTSNGNADQFVHFDNGGAFTVAAGTTATPVNLNGFTNEGSGSVTVNQNDVVNVANFQSYGTLTLNPGTFNGSSGGFTQLVNTGSSKLFFDGGSRTFISTAAQAPNINAGIDLHGNDAVVAGGLLVNNGYVIDSTGGGHRIVADFGAVVKGAGFYQTIPQTINGGTFSTGNSPGGATAGAIVLGGPNDPNLGLSNYTWQINDAGPSATYPTATGTAGPTANAAKQVSGWGLLTAVAGTSPVATTGNFQWDATPSDKLTIHLQTLLAPNDVNGNTVAGGGYGQTGDNTAGLMSGFDPTKSYVWKLFAYQGTYTGPTDTASLDASTVLDDSGFLNPHNGRFDLVLNQSSREMDLTFTPTAVPEPGTMLLLGAAGIAGVAGRLRRKRQDHRKPVESVTPKFS